MIRNPPQVTAMKEVCIYLFKCTFVSMRYMHMTRADKVTHKTT